jgi:ribose-phosphate pyrophosphokinase
MMIARKCVEDGATDVCAVIPYLAYSRQDRPFLEGELATIALIAKLFDASGIRSVLTVDMHSQLGMSQFSTVSIQNVSSIPLLARYAKSMNLHNPLAVSPDSGGAQRVEEFAKHLHYDTLVLKKSRNRSTGEVTVQDPDVDMTGREALLVDDMISSGSSIISAAKVLRRKGAKSVYALCAHALLLGDASKNLATAGIDDIVATNSIPNPHAKIDLSRTISESLASRYGG